VVTNNINHRGLDVVCDHLRREGDRRLLNPLWHQTLRSGLCRREILVQT
jgi:hypothetical protein